MKETINMNDKIEKAQTHRVTVTAEFLVITSIESKIEGAQAMVNRLVEGTLQELSPAKNLQGYVAVFLKVTEPSIEEATEEVERRREWSGPETVEVQTRQDDGGTPTPPERQETPVSADFGSKRIRVDSWRPEEHEILHKYYSRHGGERVRRELRRLGFDRSLDAISSQASKVGAVAVRKSGITPAARAAMRLISDVGPATLPELMDFQEISGSYTYHQLMYGLRKAEVSGLVRGTMEPYEHGSTIRWELTAKGRIMSYTNGSNGGQAEAMDSRGTQDTQAHLPEVRV